MKILLISTVMLFISVSCFGVVTEKDQADKIVFIRIKLIEGKPVEANYELLKGRVKTPKIIDYKVNDIIYEILTDKDSLVAEGAAEDLSNKMYEYVNDKGDLNTVNVKQDSTEIVVRVNYNEKISKINLLKVPDNFSLKKIKEELIPIGSFPIKLD